MEHLSSWGNFPKLALMPAPHALQRPQAFPANIFLLNPGGCSGFKLSPVQQGKEGINRRPTSSGTTGYLSVLSQEKTVEVGRVETALLPGLNYQLPYTTKTSFLGLTHSLRLLFPKQVGKHF